MILFKKSGQLQQVLRKIREKNQVVGFVPTMGALHPGHLRLIREARKNCDVVVCSIFVNPTQFNDPADLLKYPRTIERDIQLLENNDCDLLFYPEVHEVYPSGTKDTARYDLGQIEFVLEGKYRPGHFQGVADVVSRLFKIVAPDAVFFGQKDLQQTKVINKLLSLDPDFEKIRMNIVPTLREKSHLAMSSRNTRLTPEQLAAAPVIYTSLLYLKNNLVKGDLKPVLKKATGMLMEKGLHPDYVVIADQNTLEELTEWDGIRPVAGLVAAFLGEVRLIDNMILT